MRCHSLVTLVSLAVLGLASPTSPRSTHVVHEKRSGPPSGWQARDRLDSDTRVPLRIGLKQRNLDMGARFLDEVSNPRSSKYGQHWTADEIINMFSPSDESANEVTSWLVDSGFAPERINQHANKGWIEVSDATVAEIEDLLQTEYYVYGHKNGHSHVACEEYSVPADLSASHIDMILPTVQFDAKLNKRQKRDDSGLASRAANNTGSLPKPGKHIDIHAISTNLSNCDAQITPDCLRALYNITTGTLNGSSYGIAEYGYQSYVPEDLDLFFANFSTEQVGERPTLDSVDGGKLQQIYKDFSYNSESDLDLQYAMTLSYPQQITLFQVGDDEERASFNNFLDAIDGSYCTYDGGDDPTQDGTFPDTTVADGYPYKDCGNYTAPSVISTSYSYDEDDLSFAYADRQCYEYMKLGLQGVTVLYSSGDFGVAGRLDECIDTVRFNPSFPPSCPYVTAVGATQVPNGTDIATAIASGTQPETACETEIFSGGGFSNYFSRPSYQSDAVESFLTNYPPPYTSDRYNTSGSRAYPDVSANGANFVVAVDGVLELVYGTSASSPVFGSVVALINNELVAAGKSPVGFINPTLYAYPDVLNDITEGGNLGCDTEGFESAPGWDPVTGLGTPNYKAMLELFLSL